MIKQLQEGINRIERKLNNLTNNAKRKTGFDKEEKKKRSIRENSRSNRGGKKKET